MFVFFGIFVCSSCSAQNLTDDFLDVSVTIPSTQEWAEIDLNISEVDFGIMNLSGLAVDKRKSKYYEIRNRGNINITITPKLDEGSDDIFDNIKFSKSISDSLSSWINIGDYSINMAKTSSDGSWSDWERYAIRLDLMSYLNSGEQVPFDIIDYKKTIRFQILANPDYD